MHESNNKKACSSYYASVDLDLVENLAFYYMNLFIESGSSPRNTIRVDEITHS
jgi:hypothetical protein